MHRIAAIRRVWFAIHGLYVVAMTILVLGAIDRQICPRPELNADHGPFSYREGGGYLRSADDLMTAHALAIAALFFWSVRARRRQPAAMSLAWANAGIGIAARVWVEAFVLSQQDMSSFCTGWGYLAAVVLNAPLLIAIAMVNRPIESIRLRSTNSGPTRDGEHRPAP